MAFLRCGHELGWLALRANNEAPSCAVGLVGLVGLDTCLRRYDTKQTIIPVKTGIQGREAGALTIYSRQFLYAF